MAGPSVLTRRSAIGARGVRGAAFFSCFAAFAANPCASFGCGSSLVAASGGQGGLGGLRFLGSALCANAPSVPCGCTAAALQSRCARPARALLGFSCYPLKRRRFAEGMEAAECCVLTRRSAAGAKDGCVALRSVFALRFVRRILAPHWAAAAAAWQPPAAKEG